MLKAAIDGLVSGSTLFLGAFLGIYLNISRNLLAAIMAFGSGVLISALTFDLMQNAYMTGGFISVTIGFLSGTLLYVAGDYLIDRMGGHYRKQGHGSLIENRTTPGIGFHSGTAILLGAILDGIPESLTIGIGRAAGKGIGLSMMIAVLLSNLPEGISGAQGMKIAGKSKRFIFSVWGITIAFSVLASVLGYHYLGSASEKAIALTLSLAAGAILAMIADTMIPEAFDEGGRFVALATALGFLLAFMISHYSK